MQISKKDKILAEKLEFNRRNINKPRDKYCKEIGIKEKKYLDYLWGKEMSLKDKIKITNYLKDN